MAVISRIRVAVTGAQGLPGVNTFYATDPAAATAALQSFYALVKGYAPSAVTFLVESSGDILEDTTGNATGTWSEAPKPANVGTNAGAYAAPVGMAVTWTTGQFIVGRRVKGRTFLVPMSPSAFENDGTLAYAASSAMQTAAAALINSAPGNFLVYHRKTTPTGTDGHGFPITGALVSDKAAILRSRRD